MAKEDGTLESMVTPAFWRGRRVFLTGHTGFKGSWLALWLRSLGAEVHGYALLPATSPNLFSVAKAAGGIRSTLADIRNLDALTASIAVARPEIIFHLAAQALVSEGYRSPLDTYAVNIMGTANLLEAARHAPYLKAIVVVTSDKCYRNLESADAYREGDALGGLDPYSSSKAGAELVVAAYRHSFLVQAGVRVATARAGNVFGGGDWSPQRLIPDLLSAFATRRPAILRRPAAVRPWQHVLEPLSGYLKLAEKLSDHDSFARAWNFGPDESDCLPVGEVASRLATLWSDNASWKTEASDFPHEAGLLYLDASLARQQLGWQPRWHLEEGLTHTVAWHRAWLANMDMSAFCQSQIDAYQGQQR